MRLIDADKLSKNLYDIFHEENAVNNISQVNLGDVLKEIKDTDTAYDIDKVVKQLENVSMEDRYDGMGGYIGERTVYLDDAIEIVKAGAKE